METSLGKAPYKKELTIQLRVSAEHKQLLQYAAEQQNLSLSAWLRQLALKQAEQYRAELDRERQAKRVQPRARAARNAENMK